MIATTPESRHLWLMGAKPKVSPGATAPTDEQKAAAKADATAALNAAEEVLGDVSGGARATVAGGARLSVDASGGGQVSHE